jgi:predicted NBD/HSP70 family sugar kinase
VHTADADRRTTEPLAAAVRSGPPPQLLSPEPRAGYAAGVDVGRDRVRMILTDLLGTTLWDASVAMAVDVDPQQALDTAADLIGRAVRETGVPRGRVLGAGLGIACPVGTDGELRADGVMPGWVGMRPAGELAERTGLEVRLINDANAGALAECRFGAARACDRAVYLRLSSGIGAGLVRDGRVLPGRGGFAGEIGHVTVEPDGESCRCGNRGCLETVASPPALATALSRSKGRSVTPAEFADLIGSGDRDVLRAVEDAGDAVGRALTNITMLFDPELIVIGGDLPIAAPSLLEPIRRALTRNSMGSHTPRLRVVASALGDSACVRGAAAFVLDYVPVGSALSVN